MSQVEQKTIVEIGGEEYTIKSDLPPDEIRRLAEYVDSKIQEIKFKAPNVPAVKIAVLASLHITEELFSTKKQLEQMNHLIEEETLDILKLLDDPSRS